MVNSKAHLLLDLIGCLRQVNEGNSAPCAEKLRIFKVFCASKTARKTIHASQESSASKACRTIGKQWFCWQCVSSNVSRCDQICMGCINSSSRLLFFINFVINSEILSSNTWHCLVLHTFLSGVILCAIALFLSLARSLTCIPPENLL